MPENEKCLSGHLDYLKGSIYPDVTEIFDIKDLFVDLFYEAIRNERDKLDNWDKSMFQCKEGVFQYGHYTKMYTVPFIRNLTIYTGYIVGRNESTEEYLTKPEFAHCFIEMSGQSLNDYRNLCAEENPDIYFAWRLLNDYDFKPTRVDACIDDFFQHFNLNTLAKLVEKGYFSGTFRKTPDIYRSENGGLSVYFGSAQSELILRMYNKLAERKTKLIDYYAKVYASECFANEIDNGSDELSKEYYDYLVDSFYSKSDNEQFEIMRDLAVSSDEVTTGIRLDIMKLKSWQRYEFEFRTEYALNFLNQLVGNKPAYDVETGEIIEYTNVADIVLDYLKARLTILKDKDEKGKKIPLKNTSGNKSKMQPWKPWINFISGARTINTSVEVVEPSELENTLFWKNLQYGEFERLLEWLEKHGIAPKVAYTVKEMGINTKRKGEHYIRRMRLTPEQEDKLIDELYKHM